MMPANPSPTVSIVIPCRNEESYIAACLDSIIRNDYPKHLLEVIVIDGMSEDGTLDILNTFIAQCPFIKVLANPRREQQLALNIGITKARGDIIARMDAHSTYKYNYISECVRALHEYPADNVGGRWITVPRDQTVIGKSICMASSVFFGVGNAYYRLSSLSSAAPVLHEPTWEINVAYFCCRREVFNTIGLFNEKLDRSEDIDFRARLKDAGYRTLFVPTVECYYSMRTKFGEFVRHMFKNGLWVLLPLNHAPNISFSLRHIVPLAFVLTILALSGGALYSVAALRVLEGILGCYFVLAFYYSVRIAIRERKGVYVFTLPPVFFSLHMAYGVGSVVSLFWILSTKLRRFLKDNGQKIISKRA